MKVTGSTIQQLDKHRADGTPKPKSECRDWRLWATTDHGRKSRRFHGTYSAAQDALRAFVEELDAKIPNSETFGAYAASWASWRAETGNYSPNTVSSEASAVRSLRRTALDTMRMDEITPEACRDALLWLQLHKEGGGEYRPSTLAKRYQVLSAVMQQAVDDGKVASNPMARVKRPKVRAVEREALSPAELELFLNRLDEELPLDGRVMALYLMACLGLRLGEACAIRDAEVSGTARVTSTVKMANGKVGPPKSDAGRRELPVPPRLSAKVDEWRELRARLGLRGSEYLCCTARGNMLRPTVMERWWVDKRDGIGCEGMTLHQLRHSNLSMMARHMSVFDLQRYAGWSSIAPARIYIHADMDAVAKAVELAWK